MLSLGLSSAVFGIDAYLVKVEVDISRGLRIFSTVGLPDAAVKESKDRGNWGRILTFDNLILR